MGKLIVIRFDLDKIERLDIRGEFRVTDLTKAWAFKDINRVTLHGLKAILKEGK